MSLFSNFAKRLNALNNKVNRVVRIANRASNIETQIKSIVKDTSSVVKDIKNGNSISPSRQSSQIPPSRSPLPGK